MRGQGLRNSCQNYNEKFSTEIFIPFSNDKILGLCIYPTAGQVSYRLFSQIAHFRNLPVMNAGAILARHWSKGYTTTTMLPLQPITFTVLLKRNIHCSTLRAIEVYPRIIPYLECRRLLHQFQILSLGHNNWIFNV